MAQLINTADVSGTYLSAPVTDMTQLSVELSALSIKKTSNKYLWLDDEPMTYTITVKNTDNGDPGESVSGLTVKDKIDIKVVVYDDTTLIVKIDGQDTVYTPSYNASIGELVIIFQDELAPGSVAEISFQVTKATP